MTVVWSESCCLDYLGSAQDGDRSPNQFSNVMPLLALARVRVLVPELWTAVPTSSPRCPMSYLCCNCCNRNYDGNS